MMKYFDISKFLIIGASIIAFLISIKSSFASLYQDNIAFFFSIEVIRDTIFEKSLMNFLTKLI